MANTLKTNGSWLRAGAMAVALTLPMMATTTAEAQSYPSADEKLDWTIAFGPGGGNDIMARTIMDILTKYELYPGNISAENRAGGSGAVGAQARADDVAAPRAGS